MYYHYFMKLYDKDGNCCDEVFCFYFHYVKDVYTPYVLFEGKYTSSNVESEKFSRVEFWAFSKMLHRGLVDSIDICHSDNKCVITVKSKGFTSLLCQNQPEPGMMRDVTIANILATYPDIPYVSCEESEAVNYIYIKDGSTVWDSIVNLAFRQTGIYPYVESDNKVRITQRLPAIEFILDRRNVLATGVVDDFTKIISHIHMQDVDGSYDVFNQTNNKALERNIIRHKQIPLDRQFLYKPEDAPDYKLKFSMRGNRYHYIRYMGYNYEDLFDLVSYNTLQNKKIHGIDVVFNGTMPITTLKMYDDEFFTSS